MNCNRTNLELISFKQSVIAFNEIFTNCMRVTVIIIVIFSAVSKLQILLAITNIITSTMTVTTMTTTKASLIKYDYTR